MSAYEIHAMGIVDDVISEGEKPAHVNPEKAVENVRAYVVEALEQLFELDGDELKEQRQQRFAAF